MYFTSFGIGYDMILHFTMMIIVIILDNTSVVRHQLPAVHIGNSLFKWWRDGELRKADSRFRWFG